MRRPALTRILAGTPEAAIALIVAPPGYGKTTLLAEWERRDQRPFAWLGREAVRAPRGATKNAISTRPALGQLPRLVSELSERHTSFVLVIDDAQLLEASALREAVGTALNELPAGSTIALASRTEPALPLGRLRAHRQLIEIGTQQLAMGGAEAGELLRNIGLESPPDQLGALVGRVEGWPAALYLSALAGREQEDGADRFSGQHHILTEYVHDEVLASLPEELITFAIRTSILDELSAPLCDAVLDRRGSARLLQQLARLSTLLVPVDPAHHSYRWQRVMGESLIGQLRRLDPELEPELRLRASHWYFEHGETQPAIDQAAAAKDLRRTGDLLWTNVLSHVAFGRNDRVRQWLGNFTVEQIASYAPLAGAAALSALASGEVGDSQRFVLAARAALERDDTELPDSSLATGIAVIESAAAPNGVRRMGESALKAAKSEPPDSLWRPLCLMLGGVAAHLQGNRTRAEVLLDHSIRLSGNAGPSISALCLAQRAMIAIEREDWDLAAELTDRATAVVQEWGLGSDLLSAIVFAAAAASRAHEGRIDEAKADLRQGSELLAALGDFVPWYAAQARILLGHASLWLADAVAARTLLAEASRYARKTADATIFPEWFNRAWEYMDTLAEANLAGPSSLTIAELRILRFLPSHRSFREIALQLGVSANTVKTQAHAVYRKLGAASRSEAVAQALDAGLLGQ